MKPELHPACAAFPPMPEDDLRALADDIKANGLLEPITMLGEQILDGRCRWEACEIAGVEVRTAVFQGDDPVGFVMSKNERRRHMTYEQKALTAGALSKLASASNQYQHKRQNGVVPLVRGTTQQEIAEHYAIGRAAVENGRLLVERASPHIVEMVRIGQVPVRTAAEAIRDAAPAVQATWSKDDVLREGRQKYYTYPSYGKQKSDVKPAKPERRATIDIPYKLFNFPTAEETGFPTNGTTAEKDAFYGRYGRTPVHPKEIKHLLESQGRTEALVQAIVSASNASHPDADQFLSDIEGMLSWTPQTDKTPDYAIDFAAKARRQLVVLRERLPRALARLTALDESLRAYDDQRQSA